MGPSSDLLTTADAARLLGVSVSTVNRWAAAGLIRTAIAHPGRTGPRMFRRRDVEKLRAGAGAGAA